MAPFSSILCGVDFSEHSRHAARAATAIAARVGARLRFLHVIDMLLAEAATSAMDEHDLLGSAEADLRAFVAPDCHAALPPVSPEFEVRIGRPDREILHSAEEHGATVIVVGTHGLGGFRKLFFGSVTERVLRRAMTAVVAVPLDETHRGTPGPFRLANLLAGVDLDETALPMALAAQQIASALNVPLTLVHAVPPVQAVGAWTTAFELQHPGRIERAQLSLGHLAQVIETQAPRPGIAVRSGTPAEEIADLAAKMPDAWIVVGLGGGWMLHRPGSTAYRMLCLSSAPVLALPPEAIAALSAQAHPMASHA